MRIEAVELGYAAEGLDAGVRFELAPERPEIPRPQEVIADIVLLAV